MYGQNVKKRLTITAFMTYNKNRQYLLTLKKLSRGIKNENKS